MTVAMTVTGILLSSGTRRHAVLRIGTNVSTEYTALIFRVQYTPPQKIHSRTHGATFRKYGSLTRKQ
jgi:hypothetical protein